MRVLLTTGHPAQIHNFKLLKNTLNKKGHEVFWLATEKDISKYLLEVYDIAYSFMKKPEKGIASKIKTLITNTFFAIKYMRKNNVEIVVSRVSPYLSIAAFLLKIPHIALTDTESAAKYDKLFGKFVSVLFTAKSFKKKLRKDQIRFSGNIELFYLHPNQFKPLPKEEVAKLLNINADEPYIIMRFVSWDAYHDKGLSGFTDANKIKAVKAFSEKAKVFISAEGELPAELEPYKIKIPPEKMHDALAHATLFFGESATMASESAVLGTPTIYLNENWLGYTDEEERFGLLFSYKQSLNDQQKAIEKGIELLNTSNLTTIMQENQQRFLKNKIDVTAFMVWFIENYPESAKIMKESPDYQYNFN